MERWIFKDCTSLDTIVIGSGMVNMHDRCLYGTTPSNVTILAENPPYIEDLIEEGYLINSLIIPCDTYQAYMGSEWHRYFTTIVEDCGGESVAELDESLVTVYPNPTNGVVRIEAEGIRNVSVYNALGQVVFDTESTGNIDLSAYGYGVYFIKVETREGVVVKKVRVE